MQWPTRERLVAACGLVGAVALLLIIPKRIAGSGYLNHVSGSWAALADDWAHGVLYRPLLSGLGYGGTRNFPLHIVVHGWLVRCGLPLIAAGHLISAAGACTIVAAGVVGLSRDGSPRRLALPLAVLALVSRTAVMGAAGIRGDLLPVALGVLGLALVPRGSSQSSIPAGVLFGLAVLAKPTLLWAPAGAFLAMVSSRGIRAAVSLTVTVTLVVSIGLVMAVWVSHGEMLKSFQACASGGGFSFSTLKGALGFVRPGDLIWILGGLGLTLNRGKAALVSPFCSAGLVCLPVTLFLLTSKGTHVNHLVDATVVGALAVGVAVACLEKRSRAAEIVLVIATLFGVTEAALLDGMESRPGELQRAAAALPPGKDPVLSEQPWIPLLAHERAFSIDAYNLLQTRRTTPGVDRDLLGRLDSCAFRAVVLFGRPDAAPWWYDFAQFGPGFRQHLLSHYAFQGVFGAHAFYVPRCGSSAPSVAEVTAAQEPTILERGVQRSAVREFVSALLGRAHQ